MKLISKRVILILFAVAIFVLIGSVRCSHEFRVASNPHNQVNPAIYKDIVVWEDDRNGNPDIYGYNLSTKEEFQITDNVHDQKNPAIHQNIVVWEDNRNYNIDIYGYNLTTDQEFQITSKIGNQRNPSIYNNIVVWEDDRNGNRDIYGVNLKTKEEFQITDTVHDQITPKIFEDIVVWEEINNNSTIYGYNIETQEQFKISDTENLYCHLAIYGDTVVWVDERLNNEECLYSYDLSAKKRSGILIFRNDIDDDLILYKDIVVWATSYRERNISGYNLKTAEKLQITTSQTRKQEPAMHNDIVVWAEKRNNNWDIYGCYLGSVPTEPLSRSKILILTEYIPLPILYILLAALTIVGSYGIVKVIGRSKFIRKESKDSKYSDFKYSDLNAIYPLVISIISLLIGFFFVYQEILFGFIFLAYILISFAVYSWLKRIPFYVRVTPDEIIIYPTTMPPEVISWDTIKDIKFQPLKSKIKLILFDGSSAEIDLSLINRMERANIASILSVRFSKIKPPK